MGKELQAELNRLAGTTDMEAAGAASLWAQGSIGLELVGALNVRAGTRGLELNGVLKRLGLDFDSNRALSDAAETTRLENVLRLPGVSGNYVSTPDTSAVSLVGGGTETKTLRVPGTAGAYASTPDSAALSVTGDLDVRCKVTMDDWTPSATQYFVSKFLTTGNQRSWVFGLTSGGLLTLEWSADGITLISKTSTVATGIADGATKWVRATLDVDVGGITNEVKFYTSDDGSAWTQLGTTVSTALATSIFDSTAVVGISGHSNGASSLAIGNVYSAEIRNGIDGTIVASPDFTNWNPGETSKTDTQGNVWTVNGTASISRQVQSDLDIRAKVAFDNWIPSTTDRGIVGKWSTPSYLFTLTSTGALRLYTSVNGVSTAISQTSSVAVGAANGTALWVRVTLDIDNGSSNGDVKFYTSTDGTTWTQLGTTQTRTGTAGIFDSTSALAVGAYPTSGVEPMYVYYADVRNSIGGSPVAVFDVSKVPVRGFTSPTTHTASTNEVWTINGTAWWWDTYTGTRRYTNALRLPGTAGNYASTPDSAALSIVGDIDIRIKLAQNNWAASEQYVTKDDNTSNQEWFFGSAASGTSVAFGWWDSGGTLRQVSSSTGHATAAGTVTWLRVTLDVDNGSGGHAATFYKSTDGSSWTIVGVAQNAGAFTTSIRDQGAAVALGARSNGGSQATGRVYYAEIRNGIAGTVVGVFDPQAVRVTDTRLPTTVPSRTGESWTLNGTAWDWQVEG